MNRVQPLQKIWTARILIGTVLLFNLQCAMVFILWPEAYVSGFELSGTGGLVALQGMGILFIMWNIPYLLALTNPPRRRTSLVEAIWMQTVAVCGETLLRLFLPVGHLALEVNIQRFILFDAGGLVCLLAAWLLVRCSKTQHQIKSL
jgi:hypothetical protein